MERKNLFIIAAAGGIALTISAGVFVVSQAANPSPVWELHATDKVISLDSSNAPASITSTSVKDGCEEETLDSGNDYVTWDYYNAKKSISGHVVLSIGNEGIEESCTGFVQNHMPITGLNSINITFGSSGIVNIYGSNLLDGEYVFLDALEGDADESVATDRIVDYQYIRIANASTSTDLDIKSIEYHYTCDQINSVEKNDRMIPALSYSKNRTFAGETSTVITLGEGSAESFVFNTSNSASKIYITLGFDIPKAELNQYKLVYYTNTEGISASKGFDSEKHDYTRLAFKACYESGGSYTEGFSGGKVSPNIYGAKSWTKNEYTFEELFNNDIDTNMTLASGSVNALRIGLAYQPVSGNVYIDQLHVERIGGSYIKGVDLYEEHDITNEAIGGWGAKDGSVTSSLHSPLTSRQCFAATLTNEYSSIKFGSLNQDMTGKTISFDMKATLMKYDGTVVASYDQFIKFSFSYGGTIGNAEETNFYTTSNIHLNNINSTYYTVSNLGDSWFRITIDFDKAAENITPAAGSYNVGIETRGTFKEVAIDNMYLS